MTIPTTLGALVQAEPALATICALKLPAKSAYHVKKLAQLVASETKHFNAERDGYIRELGTTRADGSITIVPDDTPALSDFMQRMTDLAAVAVDIAWGPVTLAMLDDQRVSANDLAALGPLLADPVEEVPA